MTDQQFGHYRLEALIGRGGMGEVHRAVDTTKDRVVALKRLSPGLAADPDFEARFRRESRAVARLREPHIIPIHDFGEIDGRLYIDMRLVDGRSLAALIAEEGPLPPARAVGIVAQVASALAAAHGDGVVHRDVKPSNVLVTTDEIGADFVYLVDFGVAQTSTATGAVSRTGTGGAFGTLDYMAPERFGEARGDHRVDVYSLACLLHETITGRKPFSGDGLPAMIYAHLTLPPPRPSELVPGLPAGLDTVIARGMAKDPGQRYPTAAALAAAARDALSERPRSRPSPGPSGGPSGGPPPGPSGGPSSSPSTGPSGGPPGGQPPGPTGGAFGAPSTGQPSGGPSTGPSGPPFPGASGPSTGPSGPHPVPAQRFAAPPAGTRPPGTPPPGASPPPAGAQPPRADTRPAPSGPLPPDRPRRAGRRIAMVAAVVLLAAVSGVGAALALRTFQATSNGSAPATTTPTAPAALALPYDSWKPIGTSAVTPGEAAGSLRVTFPQRFWGGVHTEPTGIGCDYTLTGSGRVISGRGYGFGIRADLTGAQPIAQAFQYDTGLGGYRITQYPDGDGGTVVKMPVDNGWHRFSMSVRGDRYEVRVDDVVTASGATNLTCGGLMLRVWDGGVAEFRDLAVTPVTPG